jgi:hypothetical protein
MRTLRTSGLERLTEPRKRPRVGWFGAHGQGSRERRALGRSDAAPAAVTAATEGRMPARE